MTNLNELQAQVAQLLRRYASTDNTGEREGLGKQIATLYVEARERFVNGEGEPDLAGRTYAYREWVGEAFSLAGISAGDKNRVSAAVRYHVPGALRAKFGADRVTALGLNAALPRERKAIARQDSTALVRLLTSAEPMRTTDDAVVALQQVTSVLGRLRNSIVHGELRASSEALESALGPAWRDAYAHLNAIGNHFPPVR